MALEFTGEALLARLSEIVTYLIVSPIDYEDFEGKSPIEPKDWEMKNLPIIVLNKINE